VPEVNAVGDLVLTDAREMLALADPLALALTDRLRRDGPAGTDALATGLDVQASEVDARLRELEAVGIVERSGSDWRAVANGFVFEIPDDEAGQAAARQLTAVILLQYLDVPRRWAVEDEPRLDLGWARAAGLFNARVALTPDELRTFQEDLEALLAPYLTRADHDIPAEARRVRILGYFLPEAGVSPG
jgi:DNA-binding Lrp family transcriptional regulator